MKKVVWAPKALNDVQRLIRFLEEVKPSIALELLDAMALATDKLITYPHMGEAIEAHLPKDIRRYMVGEYELRYEVKVTSIHILRIYHTKEDRLH